MSESKMTKSLDQIINDTRSNQGSIRVTKSNQNNQRNFNNFPRNSNFQRFRRNNNSNKNPENDRTFSNLNNSFYTNKRNQNQVNRNNYKRNNLPQFESRNIRPNRNPFRNRNFINNRNRFNNDNNNSGYQEQPMENKRIFKLRNQRNVTFGNNQNKPEDRKRLYISNLNKTIINSELKAIFEKVGRLKRCGIHWDNVGNSLGTADVEYYNSNDATKAIEEYNKAKINEEEMLVEFSRNETKRTFYKNRLGARSDMGRSDRGGLNIVRSDMGGLDRGRSDRGRSFRGRSDRGRSDRGRNNNRFNP